MGIVIRLLFLVMVLVQGCYGLVMFLVMLFVWWVVFSVVKLFGCIICLVSMVGNLVVSVLRIGWFSCIFVMISGGVDRL